MAIIYVYYICKNAGLCIYKWLSCQLFVYLVNCLELTYAIRIVNREIQAVLYSVYIDVNICVLVHYYVCNLLWQLLLSHNSSQLKRLFIISYLFLGDVHNFESLSMNVKYHTQYIDGTNILSCVTQQGQVIHNAQM